MLSVVKSAYAANKAIVFNGDGYSEEWHAEAAARGLSNLPQTPDALPALISESAVEVMGDYDVLSERELESRYEVFVEQYIAKVNIEAETAAAIARTQILPAAVRHLNELRASGIDDLVTEVQPILEQLVESLRRLEAANSDHPEEC